MRYELRAMSVGAILDRSLRIYLSHFGILLAVSLCLSVPVAILELALAAGIGGIYAGFAVASGSGRAVSEAPGATPGKLRRSNLPAKERGNSSTSSTRVGSL